jgi:hypothetical protein
MIIHTTWFGQNITYEDPLIHHEVAKSPMPSTYIYTIILQLGMVCTLTSNIGAILTIDHPINVYQSFHVAQVKIFSRRSEKIEKYLMSINPFQINHTQKIRT